MFSNMAGNDDGLSAVLVPDPDLQKQRRGSLQTRCCAFVFCFLLNYFNWSLVRRCKLHYVYFVVNFND